MSAVVESPPITTIRPYADYSFERKAEVIALVDANNGNVLQTSRDTGIPHNTIREWLTNADKYSDIRKQKSVTLAQKLENQANYYLELAEDKAAEAPFNHLMTGAGIAIDKMQLLRGQPTSINVGIGRDELAELLSASLGEAIDVTPEKPVIDDPADVT